MGIKFADTITSPVIPCLYVHYNIAQFKLTCFIDEN